MSVSAKLGSALQAHRENTLLSNGLDKNGKPLSATPENLAAARAATAQLGRLEKKAMKLAKKENVEEPEILVYWLDPDFTAHLTVAEKAFFVNECHPIMVRAHKRFVASCASVARTHEKSLHELFVHMKEHEAFYFGRFFASDHTEPWLDKCVGMLGTFATILRQRGDYHACFDVLQIDWRVLSRLTEVVTRNARLGKEPPIERQIVQENLQGLTHKYLLIKNNLRGDMVLPVPVGMAPCDEMGPDLRALMRYEIETDAAVHGVAQYLPLLECAGYPPTLKGLARASNLELWLIHEKSIAQYRERQQRKGFTLSSHLPLHDKVLHHTCAGCGRAEPFLNTFPRCAGCCSVFYHSQECQRQDWKAKHKGQCKALNERRKREAIATPVGGMPLEGGELAPTLPPHEQLLPVGTTVQLQGLTTAKSLNGHLGKVLATKAEEAGCAVVRMRDATVRAVKICRLLCDVEDSNND